jgi:serine/threonine protein kinase
VLELVDGGNLRDYIDENEGMSTSRLPHPTSAPHLDTEEHESRRITYQMCNALAVGPSPPSALPASLITSRPGQYIHSKGIVHRDLKPAVRPPSSPNPNANVFVTVVERLVNLLRTPHSESSGFRVGQCHGQHDHAPGRSRPFPRSIKGERLIVGTDDVRHA